jgi:nicotinamide-nucleotide amidase
MFDNAVATLARELLETLRQRHLKLATVESCTGGLVAAALTAIPGSSDVVERSWVTYSNTAKQEEVGVSSETLAAHGAVSEPVARAMAEGALQYAPVDMALAITGIAGPSGATATKPVGLVYIACALKGTATVCHELRLGGDRDAIRHSAMLYALELALRQSQIPST